MTNDQEYKRFGINNVVDERTLREIYFRPFGAAVRQGQAGSVMLAYNKLNGLFCAQDPFLMRTVLEAEWGFCGVPVSDYGAVHDPVAAIQAGLDTAREGITLLKNEGNLLPFGRGQTRSIAVVGHYAGGGPPSEAGSGSVVPIHYTSELDGLKQVARGATRVVYLHAVFPGLDGGLAQAEILFGEVNPSGKLRFTFENQFQDNPAYPNYPNDPSVDPTGNTAVYREGLFMGYRGFDKNGVEPQYPFGYGLSYTTFQYSDLSVAPAALFPDVKLRKRS